MSLRFEVGTTDHIDCGSSFAVPAPSPGNGNAFTVALWVDNVQGPIFSEGPRMLWSYGTELELTLKTNATSGTDLDLKVVRSGANAVARAVGVSTVTDIPQILFATYDDTDGPRLFLQRSFGGQSEPFEFTSYVQRTVGTGTFNAIDSGDSFKWGRSAAASACGMSTTLLAYYTRRLSVNEMIHIWLRGPHAGDPSLSNFLDCRDGDGTATLGDLSGNGADGVPSGLSAQAANFPVGPMYGFDEIGDMVAVPRSRRGIPLYY